MVKIRFELNIDEVVKGAINISSDDPLFKNPEATGKTFLIIDALDNHMQAVLCRHAATESNQFAQLDFYPIPAKAVIIDENVNEDASPKELMAHIQDCCDKVCKTIQTYADIADSKHSIILQSLAPVLERAENSTGNGISEKTLLDALKIVANNTERHETT